MTCDEDCKHELYCDECTICHDCERESYGELSKAYQSQTEIIAKLKAKNSAFRRSIEDLLENENTYRMSEHEAKHDELQKLLHRHIGGMLGLEGLTNNKE